MKYFLLGTLLLAALGLLLVDLKIKNKHITRDKILIQAEINSLRERQGRIQSEIQIELADPELEVYIVSTMGYESDLSNTRRVARDIAQGRTDTRRVNNSQTNSDRP